MGLSMEAGQMKTGTILAAALVMLLIASAAYAGDDLKIGSAGGQQLRIPVGSRGTAMGGSTVANSYGLDALYWNPAGASSIEGTEVMWSNRQYIADIDINYFAGARRVGDFGVIGFNAKITSMDDEIVRTIDFPEGTGATFSSSFAVIGATYARTLTDRVSLGINSNVIYEKIAEQTAMGLGFDIGFHYNPGWQNVTFGAVIKNLGPKMRYDGPGFDWDTETGDDPNSLPHTTRSRSAAFEIPSYVQLGAAYKLFEQQKNVVNVSGAFQSNNFSEDEWRFGGEYAWDGKFFLRGGYTASNQDDYLYGASFGAGLKFNVGDSRWQFDYAWSASEFFDDNQYFTFQVGF
jgi:hypothetical protein